MEVVDDEIIVTASTVASKFYDRTHQMDNHRTVATTMPSPFNMMTTNGSNLSVETHPPSKRSNNPFSNLSSSSDTLDSRQDSPKEQEDSDAMMTSDDVGSGFVSLQASSSTYPLLPTSLTTRVVTGENRTSANISNSSTGRTFVCEEKVTLAPRIEKIESRSRDPLDKPMEREVDISNSSLFSLSGSMSSEFLEHQQNHPDHQQEYLDRMNSPTSTTARDFLREVQCPPPLPTLDGDREGAFTSSRTSLNHRFSHNGQTNHQLPPFHPPSAAAASNLPSHPTLPREHMLNASLTNTIQGAGSCNSEREKPAISRCFAWSQDSQDDRRLTKRAKLSGQNGMASAASSPPSPISTDTAVIMSPSCALATIRACIDHGPCDISDSHTPVETRSSSILHRGDHSPSPPPTSSSSPTKVHWEEKIDNSNELMSHAVDPHILFGVSVAIQSAIEIASSSIGKEDVAMGNNDESDLQQWEDINSNNNTTTRNDLIAPPIATANSASNYSFDSL